MEFSIKTGNPEKLHADCILVGVFEEHKLSDSAKLLDDSSHKEIAAVLKSGDMTGKLASTLVLHHVPKIEAKRVMLVGLGKAAEFNMKSYRKCVSAAIKAMPKGVETASLFLTELAVDDAQVSAKVAHMVEAILDASYQVNAIKAKKADANTLQKINIYVEKKEQTLAEQGLKQGLATAHGVALAKDLGNLPPNICTPTYLSEQAKKMAKTYGFKVEVLDKAAIEKLGMGSFLGVAQGSEEPPKFIVMQHLKGKKEQKPVVLVGKGITFDTGGISLKPGAEMDEMKYDMCGAASVLGTFRAIGEMDLAINAVAVIPTCDNMPSGHALKPGDVVTSMSGQTIEVLNTDAEGRLILCDALTYAERFEPSAVIDVATLTGACVIALGHHATGLFSNKDSLAHELLAAGEAAQDRAWHMPLWDD
jgi:leucyl aminopeptidase